MTFKDTGLLPEKMHEDKIFTTEIPLTTSHQFLGYNQAIEEIRQIPFDPVKYVEVDEKALADTLKPYFGDDFLGMAHCGSVLLQSAPKWLKEKVCEK